MKVSTILSLGNRILWADAKETGETRGALFEGSENAPRGSHRKSMRYRSMHIITRPGRERDKKLEQIWRISQVYDIAKNDANINCIYTFYLKHILF